MPVHALPALTPPIFADSNEDAFVKLSCLVVDDDALTRKVRSEFCLVTRRRADESLAHGADARTTRSQRGDGGEWAECVEHVEG